MSPASSSESAETANGRALQQIEEDRYCMLENVIEPKLSLWTLFRFAIRVGASSPREDRLSPNRSNGAAPRPE